MGDSFTTREFQWTESSGGPFAADLDSSSQYSDEDESPFVRHGHVIEADPDNVDMQRDF